MEEEKAVTVQQDRQTWLTPQDVKLQVNHIQQIMRAVMKDGEHYGKIPGCGPKPALLKPGAEKLVLTFRLCPKATVQEVELGNAHKEYKVSIEMLSNKGTFLGTGYGTCSTMETRYRYRSESTGKPVPKEYWETRDANLLGGDTYSARKVQGAWVIVQRVEHDNPADYYNTCAKMAKKRALVDAVLTVTGASDIFTQDIEEMHPEPEKEKPKAEATVNPEAEVTEGDGAPPDDMPPEEGTEPAPGTKGRIIAGDDWRLKAITDAQRKRLYAICKEAAMDFEALVTSYGYASSKDIKRGDYEDMCKVAQARIPKK